MDVNGTKKHVTTAAKNGHLEVLKWAHDNGCSWDETTCHAAAENGHLEVLIWARENGCDWNKDTCIELAASRNHIKIVEWIKSHKI